MNSHHVQQLAGTLSTVCSGETLLINPATGRFYSLSPSASLAWSALAEPHAPAEVIRFVLSHHANPPLTAASELSSLIAELQQEGLLVPAPPAESAPLPPPDTLAPYTTPTLHRGSLSQAANGVSGIDDGQTTGFGTPLLS